MAETIARHLVAAAMLVDSEPELALQHARAASARLPRMAAVREAVGVAAYHAGEYATALLELRAARRIDGSPRNLPLMADAERGLGRPERAVDCLSDPGVAELDAASRVELLIVVSGARRDLGQPEAAAVLLRDEATVRSEPRPWSPRLWYAYAEALLAAGREVEALRWFTAAAGIDEGETDAAERAYELTVIDDEATAEPEDHPNADDSDNRVNAASSGFSGDASTADSDADSDAEAGTSDAEAGSSDAEVGSSDAEAGSSDAVHHSVDVEGSTDVEGDADQESGIGVEATADAGESEPPAGVTGQAPEPSAEEPAHDSVREPADGPVRESEEEPAQEPADELATGGAEAATVDFSAAGDGTTPAVAADGGAPIPEIVFSDAPGGAGGGGSAADGSPEQDGPPA